MRILEAITGYGAEHLGGGIHPDLAHEMRRRGHDYQLFTLAHVDDLHGGSPDRIEDGVPVHRAVCRGRPLLDLLSLATRPVLRYPWLLAAAWRLRRFLRSRPPFDVVSVEGAYPFGAACWWATRWNRVPYVVTVLGGDFLANDAADYGYARYAFPRYLMRRVFGDAAIVRSISPFAAERARDLGCPAEKSVVLQSQIAASAFPPAGTSLEAYRQAATDVIRERFSLGNARLVVAVGRLLPIKGFDVLVRALPGTVAAAGNVRVLHVGPNRGVAAGVDYRTHLEGLARTLGVSDRLLFAGPMPLEEIRSVLAAADVLAVPSIEEGANKVIPEAAAVGTPIVATRTSGNAPWAGAWGCAVVVEPSSPAGLADGIVRILSERSVAAGMCECGPGFAEAFRTERVAARLLALCEVAVSGRALPAGLREAPGLAPLVAPVTAGA